MKTGITEGKGMEINQTETVEMAAENIWQRGRYKNDERGKTIYIIGAKFGAQWQAKHSYSESELLEIVKEVLSRANSKRDYCCDLNKTYFADLLKYFNHPQHEKQ